MKKIFALIFAIIMVFALTACGGGSSNGGGNTTQDTPTPTPTPTPAAPVEIEGEFFPGISDDDIPAVLMKKAGVVNEATFAPSANPDFTSEVTIILGNCPINFFSILSDHYNKDDGLIESDLPLDESLGRTFTYDWGILEMSSKEIIIETGEVHIHAFIY